MLKCGAALPAFPLPHFTEFSQKCMIEAGSQAVWSASWGQGLQQSLTLLFGAIQAQAQQAAPGHCLQERGLIHGACPIPLCISYQVGCILGGPNFGSLRLH